MTTTVAAVSLWVIYQSPFDFPGLFVARRWEVTPEGPQPTLDKCIGFTLEEARAIVPPEAVRISRMEDDDAVIVESWL